MYYNYEIGESSRYRKWIKVEESSNDKELEFWVGDPDENSRISLPKEELVKLSKYVQEFLNEN